MAFCRLTMAIHRGTNGINKSMNKIQKTTNFGLKIGLHRKTQLEVADIYIYIYIYFQFIMGNSTKWDVYKRLSAKDYLQNKKWDDGVN